MQYNFIQFLLFYSTMIYIAISLTEKKTFLVFLFRQLSHRTPGSKKFPVMTAGDLNKIAEPQATE